MESSIYKKSTQKICFGMVVATVLSSIIQLGLLIYIFSQPKRDHGEVTRPASTKRHIPSPSEDEKVGFIDKLHKLAPKAVVVTRMKLANMNMRSNILLFLVCHQP